MTPREKIVDDHLSRIAGAVIAIAVLLLLAALVAWGIVWFLLCCVAVVILWCAADHFRLRQMLAGKYPMPRPKPPTPAETSPDMRRTTLISDLRRMVEEFESEVTTPGQAAAMIQAKASLGAQQGAP